MTRPVTFTAVVAKDRELYVSRCLEVEVASQGETIEEALANLQEALELAWHPELCWVPGADESELDGRNRVMARSTGAESGRAGLVALVAGW